MIQLDELTLKRFKSHEDTTIEFKPGVNAIVGPNGSGKSSILQAIDFVFTGQSEENKEDLITKGSLGSSYVKAKFTLNGKPGEIERHLDSSKVVLKYNGEVKNKSIEVKDVWAKLLQIDSHIFKHVIIAHQKRVPELFAGESSVREKAFQKIFLVPNTEKLRTTIWNNYINTAPPAFACEDAMELQGKIDEVQRKLTPMQHKIDVLSAAILTDQQVVSVINSVEWYKRCIKDAENKPKLDAAKNDIDSKLSLLLAKETQLAEILSLIDIRTLTQQQRELLHARALFSVKMQRNDDLLKAKASFNWTPEYIELTTQTLNESSRREELRLMELAQCKLAIESTTTELAHFKEVKGHDKCPTCKQSLEDVAKFVSDLEAKLAVHSNELTQLQAQYLLDHNATVNCQDTLNRYSAAKQRIANLEKELLNYKDVNFTYKDLEQVDKTINDFRSYSTELESVRLSLNKLQVEQAVIESQLASLVNYEGTSTAAEELTIMSEVIRVNRERNDELQRVKMDVVQLTTELSMLNERLQVSRKNQDKNIKREIYLSKLKTIYDSLHTTQFPRKLIQTYSTLVEEELLINLQRFNLPYTPRIEDGFKISMLNKEGHVMPTLSGGQEMIVGLCLRLALHSMFSQSFPMLIIDEGTTHLDVDNAKRYFNCIQELRKDQVIKQLIIIDHNPDLADVVDHVIYTKV